MPREQIVVRPDGLKARVVSFERDEDLTDDAVEAREDVQRTVDEIEWARFQTRWAKWKKEFDFRPPDPSRLHVEVWG